MFSARLSSRIRQSLTILIVSGLTGACLESGDDRHAARSNSPTSFDTVFRVGSPEDSSLAQPRILAGSDAQIVLYDSYNTSVQAYDTKGNRLWAVGRQGGGPGEFRNVIDIGIAPDSTIWILDGGAGHIVRLDPATGEQIDLPLRLGDAQLRVLPLRSGTVALRLAADHFGGVLDTGGNMVATIPFPDSALALVDPFLRQPLAAAYRNSDSWAAIFPRGNVFALYDGASTRCMGRLPDAAPFPAALSAEGPPRATAIGVALLDGVVVILRQSKVRGGPSELDWYDSDSCAFVTSEVLDGRHVALASMGEVLVLVREELYPELIGVRVRQNR